MNISKQNKRKKFKVPMAVAVYNVCRISVKSSRFYSVWTSNSRPTDLLK